jgi:hypothetical protein
LLQSSGNNSLDAKGCALMSKLSWKNIVFLNLSTLKLYADDNRIGDSGCCYLVHGNFVSLKLLYLRTILATIIESNGITEKGCGHLAKTRWKNL